MACLPLPVPSMKEFSSCFGHAKRIKGLFETYRTVDFVLTVRTLTLKEAVEWGFIKVVVS